jgi:uncharacterized protein YjiK
MRPTRLLAVLLFPSSALASAFDLASYHHSSTFNLPSSIAAESSAISFNPDTGTLFVVGDDGGAILEVSRLGVPISSMFLSGFSDTEGLSYAGNGRFVIAEERIQDLFLLTYTSGATVSRSSLQSVSLGDTVGNEGIEGVSFEPSTGSYFAVKEKNPQHALIASADFSAGAASTAPLFDPASLGLLDLSDIQVLSVVPSLHGTADLQNFLILSQESELLLEVSRDGQVLSSLDLHAISGSIEGVAIDNDGVIYLCDETPRVYTLTPIPTPASVFALAALAAVRRRRGQSREA